MPAVSSLCSHIAQSDDQDSNDIPKAFKSTRVRGGKKPDKGKQKQPPPPPQEHEDEGYEEANNYNHNNNIEVTDHTEAIKVATLDGDYIGAPNPEEEANKIITEVNIIIVQVIVTIPEEVTITTITVNIMAEVTGENPEIITEVEAEGIAVSIEVIVTTNITHIMLMMTTTRWNIMAHLAHIAEDTITHLNIVSRVNMT